MNCPILASLRKLSSRWKIIILTARYVPGALPDYPWTRDRPVVECLGAGADYPRSLSRRIRRRAPVRDQPVARRSRDGHAARILRAVLAGTRGRSLPASQSGATPGDADQFRDGAGAAAANRPPAPLVVAGNPPWPGTDDGIFLPGRRGPPTTLDLTMDRGHLHPLTQFSRRVLEIWRSFGYDVHEGPELETTWFNFDGLNVPPDHPARDIQDTFFVKGRDDLVLRTHCSNVQLRWPKSHGAKPPFRVVEIGKVYRHEATDATHESMFFQCDGVLVDKHVTMAHLVTTLTAFVRRLFPHHRYQFRPSFFPFVEPGLELFIWWETPGQPGRWLEVLGAGLVHPNVIRNMGLNPKQWQGFAFGGGLDRLAMLEYGVMDIRQFYSGNLEFLKQF